MTDKILVVEDDRQTRELLMSRLEAAGYEVITTHRGDRAIQMAIKEKPDIVILDIILEGSLNGYSVARSLNSLDETSSIYIIFLSTKREVRDRVRGFATGAHDFISKEDFSSEEFIARVENGIRIKKTHDALRDRSNIDGLTELFNHRFFMEEMSKEIEKAQRHGFNLSLAFLDVDNFKSFNDRFGHYAGDRVLSRIGRLLKTTCRSTDIIARYGGEEFTVILPATDVQGAHIVMERIRSSLEASPFPIRGSGQEVDFEKVTISIGIAPYADGLSAQEFIELADRQAMYRAKAAGKNRIYLYLGVDERGNEVVVDAEGHKPAKIDCAGFISRFRELESRIRTLNDETVSNRLDTVRSAIDSLVSAISLYYLNEETNESGDQNGNTDRHGH